MRGPRRRRGGLSEFLIDRTAGTNIGDMTAAGGLAAAFDGNEDQGATACCSTGSGTSGYVGKTLASSVPISRAVVICSNNAGWISTATADVTLELYGKQGAAPSTATDGDLLSTAGPFTDPDVKNTRELDSGDKTTVYDHAWVRISTPTTTNLKRIAEVQLYGMA